MKATILRDYASMCFVFNFCSFLIFNFLHLEPVVSSCNIPTIPLVVAQAMNPAPRPPSPSVRAATQRALRRDNTEQLTSRDTRILGLNPDFKDEQALAQLDSFPSKAAIADGESSPSSAKVSAPPRPSRQSGRMNLGRTVMCFPIKLLLFFTHYLFLFFLELVEPSGCFSDIMGELPST